ncbi:hypothetical protein F4818DRAFT_431770 [Hypoxylon cercidicola]|nr:hypothetical protein F4818DRAFT_431770 [Hypoxylon cercidicola]
MHRPTIPARLHKQGAQRMSLLGTAHASSVKDVPHPSTVMTQEVYVFFSIFFIIVLAAFGIRAVGSYLIYTLTLFHYIWPYTCPYLTLLQTF